jgi:translocation protein SEC63
MQSITLGYNWLSTYLVVVTLQQHLVQAMHPALSPLVQLPHISVKTAEKLAKNGDIKAPEQYASISEQQKDSLFPELKGQDYIKKHIQAISEHWPKLELVSSEFKGKHAFFAIILAYISYSVHPRKLKRSFQS